MWDPEDNVSESLNPSATSVPPDKVLRVGRVYTCVLACPLQYQNRRFQLRVMDQQDFESVSEEQRKQSLELLPAQMDGNGVLTGEFTPQADWPERIRVGFADPTDDKDLLGLGGTEVYVVR